VKAEAFARRANDYIVKLPDRLELIARVSLSLAGLHRAGRTQRGLRRAPGQPAGARERSGDGISSTCDRCFRLRTPPARSPPTGGSSRRPRSVATPSATTSSMTDHFAMYLLDVCGHGVGAALLSVSALNAIRSEALPQTNFHDPGSVLAALNKSVSHGAAERHVFHDLVWRLQPSQPRHAAGPAGAIRRLVLLAADGAGGRDSSTPTAPDRRGRRARIRVQRAWPCRRDRSSSSSAMGRSKSAARTVNVGVRRLPGQPGPPPAGAEPDGRSRQPHS